jgi:CBS domain-containing protein
MYVQSILAAKGSEVATIRPGATVREAVARLNERKVGALVVSDDDRTIAGIISERDVVRRLGTDSVDALDLTVGDIMTREVTTCGHKDTLEQLMWLMTDQRIRHLPVIDDDGSLGGIVSIGDVVKHRLGQLESENQALYDYITHGR